MKKNVWIFNHYAGLMFFNHGGRHYNFAKHLKQSGYEPVLFCANSKHSAEGHWFEDDSVWHEHLAEEIGVPFVFVKARTYTGNGKSRVLNMVDFYYGVQKAAKQYAAKHGKPDIIYASSVHPLTLVAGIQLAKHFGVKCICEVRDLWPETIVEFSSRFTKKHPIIKVLYQGEKWIYKKADQLIFTMEGAYNYIIEQGWEKEIPYSKVSYINNGVDLEAFARNCEQYQVQDPDLEDPHTFKVLYTGSIRPVNRVDQLIGCAKHLKAYPDIKIIVYGQGSELERLKQETTEARLENLVFKGAVNKKYVPYILSKSNLNILNYRADVSILRFGSSQNKMFEYLASGRPILSSISMEYSPIEKFNCGIVKKLTQDEEYAQEILKFYSLSEQDYQALCDNAQTAAREYDFKNLTKKLIEVIEKA